MNIKKNINMKANLSSYQIAAAYIGTIVGAGFATGQEVLQFFAFFGIGGLAAIAFATLQFAVFGYLILNIANKLKAQSHLQLIRYISGPTIGYLIDLVITGFLFGALVTMAAGMGAIFTQQLELPNIIGIGLLLLVTMVTVFYGINGVISIVSYLVPALMLIIVGVSLNSLIGNFDNFIANLEWTATGSAPVPFWPLSAIIYTSYNIVIAVAVLAPLGSLATDANQKQGAIMGAVGLGIGAMVINLAIIANVPAVLQYEVPMLFISNLAGPIVTVFYTIALVVGVYTTAVASLYGFAARVVAPESKSFRMLTFGSSVMAFFLAQFGFSTLVGILFSAVGYAGLLLLGSLVYVLVTNHGVPAISRFRQWAFPGVGYRKLIIGEEAENQEEQDFDKKAKGTKH
ncbi:MAG: hypothetical protein SCK28_05150 [Bacillota bacterium]|nr:hypothetical protein [Bacillota bacterium]